MEPDRFDDVAFRMLEQPEPPRRRPRVRRWTLGALSVVTATGALAAGASALTGDDAAPPAKVSHRSSLAAPHLRDHHGDCKRGKPFGERRHERRDSALRY